MVKDVCLGVCLTVLKWQSMKKESGEMKQMLSVWTARKLSVFWHSVLKPLKKWHNAMVSDGFLRGH